jgi:hypothetical protein
MFREDGEVKVEGDRGKKLRVKRRKIKNVLRY